MSTPDVVIVWGIRSIMSLVGILTIVTFYWYTERKWDEEGAAAYERAVENAPGGDYSMVEEDGSPKKKFVTNSDGSRDAISVATEDFKGDEIEVPKGELEKAHSKQYGMIVGFTIWAISFLFLPGSIQIYGGWNISFILFLPVIVFLITSPIRTATIGRDVDLKKKAVSTVLVLAIWLCVSGIVDSRTNAPWFFCFFGVAVLFLSYHITRRSRKMGISWEMEGKPASQSYSQSLTALTLIFGFFLIWVGTNATAYDANAVNVQSVPIYVNYRAWFVFLSALVIIVPSAVALDYAFNQGSKPVEYGQNKGGIYKLDGSTFIKMAASISWFTAEPFAAFLETPWPLMTGWAFFGLCAFMPFGRSFTIQKLIACVLAFLVGTVYTFRVLPAYWNGNLSEYKKWTYVYYAFMVFLFTTIGVQGQGPLIASMTGVILILLGQHIDMLEKKKGKTWMREGELNPNEVTFGYGQPVYISGWLLLCMAMAIPMNV